LLPRWTAWLAILALAVCACPAAAQVKVDNETFAGLEPRAIGPAVMSGRIAAIDAVQIDDRLTVYVGAAGGGLWKSMDGAITFKPIFDKYNQCIGDVRIAPSNPKVVWLATGEPWVRNSVSVGDGVYKSTDGGDNWTKVGLDSTERVSRMCIDPKNPDRVFVGALGPLWNASPQRGVYRTTDGGKTWQKVLYVDENTGVGDLAMDPSDPNTLYASMWQMRRKPYAFISGGPGSALYKTTDGGATWKKLTTGLPNELLGRIAIDVSPADPTRVYAVVEARKAGGFYVSNDKGESWALTSTSVNVSVRPFYFARMVAHPKVKDKVYKPGLNLMFSDDGGKTFATIAGSTHGDHHALWVNPTRPTHMILGTDGGVYVTEDGGNNWRAVGTLPVGQFYHVSLDNARPYNVYGGLQDNGTWTGPSHNPGGIGGRHWRNIDGGDGFWAFPDPNDQDLTYTEYQGGRISRFRKSNGEQKNIAPMQRIGDPKLRFNWNSPIHVGAKSGRLYYGSQFLFRSADKGDTWDRISPDLTTNDPVKQQQEASGGVSIDNSSAENHCTIFTICESPLNGDVIWVGTDDGNLQFTRDGGKSWNSVAKNVTGLPPGTWVSRVEASPHAEGTVFATFDGHATGDMKTHVYRSTDYGKTWTSIGTPELKGYAHVIRQDLVNPELLFLGTEWGLYLTVDGGKQWGQMSPGLPNVAVRDVAIHPRDGDLVIATHGRGIYVLDDLSPIRALSAEVEKDFAFLPSRPAQMFIPNSEQRFDGDAQFAGTPLNEAAWITYYLKKRHLMGDLKVEIYDASDKLITSFPGGKRRGINRVEWQMRMKPPRTPAGANVIRAPGSFLGPRVPDGEYTVKLIKGKETFTSKVTLVPDPRASYTAEDRKAQHETVTKLYGMMGELTYLHDRVMDARSQTLARLEQLPAKDGARKPVQTFADDLQKQRGMLSAQREGWLTGEEQLRERLGTLYGAVNNYDGRPTNSMLDNMKLMEKELADATTRIDALMTKSLPSVNAALTKAKLEGVTALTRESWEAKQSSGGAAKASGEEEGLVEND
jgi:photosystem II stability/assembly factor-like uncharacterized protein